MAPACADATILVRVKNGEPAEPIVTKGSRRCPVGTRGSDAIGFEVPSTVDDAFAEMARYIESPPVRAEVTAKFDGVTGVPRIYYVRKLDIDDNDEGFEIVNFRVAK